MWAANIWWLGRVSRRVAAHEAAGLKCSVNALPRVASHVLSTERAGNGTGIGERVSGDDEKGSAVVFHMDTVRLVTKMDPK